MTDMTTEQALNTANELIARLPILTDVEARDYLVKIRSALKALSAPREPVGWQFYQDGKWWNGDDRIKDHKKNTQEAGFRVRDVYAAPVMQGEPADHYDQAPDWSKAPEGATHWGPGEDGGAYAAWYREKDGEWECWLYPSDHYWGYSNPLGRILIPRPEPEWIPSNGQEPELPDDTLYARTSDATPQPAEQQPDVTQLVEALEEARLTLEVMQGRGSSVKLTLEIIDRALVAHRKQGDIR